MLQIPVGWWREVAADAGLIDADLGGGVIKQRIARAGGGKSGGYRSIVLYRAGDRAIWVYGFAKSDRANITAEELVAFRRRAGVMLSHTTAQLDQAVESGALAEVDCNAENL